MHTHLGTMPDASTARAAKAQIYRACFSPATRGATGNTRGETRRADGRWSAAAYYRDDKRQSHAKSLLLP